MRGCEGKRLIHSHGDPNRIWRKRPPRGGRVVLVDRNWGGGGRVKERMVRPESWKANRRVEVRGVTLRAGGGL